MIFLLFVLLTLSACGSKGKVYRVGIDANWYPLKLMGKESNVYAFTDDLLLAISHEEGACFERISVCWDNLIFGLKEGHYDGVLTAMTPRVHMKNIYEFSETFLRTGPVLIVRSDGREEGIERMTEKRVAVVSLQDETLLLKLCPGAISRYYDSVSEGLNELILHNIDAMIVDYFLALNYMQSTYDEKIKIASRSLLLQDAGLRLLTLHGENRELIKVFNQGLKKIYHNGTYDRLLKKWGLR